MNFQKRLIFIVFIFFLLYFYKIFILNNKFYNNALENNKFIIEKRGVDLTKLVTLIIRWSEYMKDNIKYTALAFMKLYPNISIIIVSDQFIPAFIKSPKVLFIHLSMDLAHLTEKTDPLLNVETPYVYIPVPGSRSFSLSQLVTLYNRIQNCLIIIPTSNSLTCRQVNLNLKEWTLRVVTVPLNNTCHITSWDFGIFTHINIIKKFPQPFMKPFPEPLQFQAKLLNIPLKFSDFRLQTKNDSSLIPDEVRQYERTAMYYELGIKKVVRDESLIEWYGCTRNTTRCFGTVVNSTPDYLLTGRWTPPCCLRVLREVGRHVFKTLTNFSVRYWLEGGSLLGAMRNNNIIPWDYDIDVGIYEEDIKKHPLLRKLNRFRINKQYAVTLRDSEGFVWELAKPDEGANFFRVLASARNRLHVDIFPFRRHRGAMVRSSYLPNHKQDRPFPETFLKPLTTIPFIGLSSVSAPNNIREFLELKFGSGAIENPEYPNG